MPTYRLRETISSIKATLKSATFPFTVLKTINKFKRVNVWNNQISGHESGEGYSIKTPAAFVELNKIDTTTVGQKITHDDYILTVHIALDKKNATDNDMDENLDIFWLRDVVKELFHGNKFDYTSTIQYLDERPDYAHKSVYHYEIDFAFIHTDVKGSPCDPDNTSFIIKETPTDLDLTVELVDPDEL